MIPNSNLDGESFDEMMDKLKALPDCIEGFMDVQAWITYYHSSFYGQINPEEVEPVPEKSENGRVNILKHMFPDRIFYNAEDSYYEIAGVGYYKRDDTYFPNEWWRCGGAYPVGSRRRGILNIRRLGRFYIYLHYYQSGGEDGDEMPSESERATPPDYWPNGDENNDTSLAQYYGEVLLPLSVRFGAGLMREVFPTPHNLRVFQMDDGNIRISWRVARSAVESIGRAKEYGIKRDGDEIGRTGSFSLSYIDDSPGGGLSEYSVRAVFLDTAEPVKSAVAASADRLAVLPGSYDDIEGILDKMNRGYEIVSQSDLEDYESIKDYRAIFINCTGIGNAAQARDSLRQYVSQGGVLYGSDWAMDYFYEAFPGYAVNPRKDGSAPQTVTGRITDPGLSDYLGQSEMDVHFDAGGWVVVEDVSDDVTVYLESKEPVHGVDNLPMLFSFRHGMGKVIYSSVHMHVQDPAMDEALEYLALMPITGPEQFELQDYIKALFPGLKLDAPLINTINEGATSEPVTVTAPGDFDMVFSANWAGSEMKLSVYDPAGNLYDEVQSDEPPIVIEVPNAEKGDWSYTATAVSVPHDNYAYVTAAGQTAVDRVVITPGHATVAPGGSQIFTAVAYDAQNNEIADVTEHMLWADDIPESTWVDNEVTAQTAGTWTVTGTYEDIEVPTLMTVGDPFGIQWEIYEVIGDPEREIVVIEPGTHEITEPIVIGSGAEGVTLKSKAGEHRTFIDAAREEYAIIILADNVTLEGFTIQNFSRSGVLVKGDNATIRGNVIDGADAYGEAPVNAGVIVHGAEGTLIRDNTVEDAHIGVLVRSLAMDTLISNNTIARNVIGIMSQDYEGDKQFPVYTTAINNQIFSNADYGIHWNAEGEELWAGFNWWGDRSGPEHAENPGVRAIRFQIMQSISHGWRRKLPEPFGL